MPGDHLPPRASASATEPEVWFSAPARMARAAASGAAQVVDVDPGAQLGEQPDHRAADEAVTAGHEDPAPSHAVEGPACWVGAHSPVRDPTVASAAEGDGATGVGSAGRPRPRLRPHQSCLLPWSMATATTTTRPVTICS